MEAEGRNITGHEGVGLLELLSDLIGVVEGQTNEGVLHELG